jgi:hypothetical protein
LRVWRFDGLGSCSSRHLITCFLSSEKLHHRQEVDPGFIRGLGRSHHLPPHLLRSLWGSSKRCLLRISSSARWKRWTLTRPRYQRRRQPRGLAPDCVEEARTMPLAGFRRGWSGRTTPRTTDAAALGRRMVSGYRCCFSHVSRVGFSSLNAFVSSVAEQRSSLLSRWRTSAVCQWLYGRARPSTEG